MRPAESESDRQTGIRRIFLVDDEPLILSALTRVMRQEGFLIESFSQAADALEALRADQPDCIISDYYMPRTDGLEFLEEVKTSHPQVARILLTGGNIDEKVRQALNDVVMHVLIQKPWHIDSIRLAMEHVHNGDSGIFLEQKEEPGASGLRPVSPEISTIRTDKEHGATVLVVDDEESFLAVAEGWLEHMGFESLGASSVDRALDLARDKKPDVAIIDLIMPGDGFKLLAALRDLYPRTPIVAITGAADRDMAVKAFQAGANAFLHKPIEMQTMEATIRRCLQLGGMFFNGAAGSELSILVELQHAIAAGMPVPQLMFLLLQEMIRHTQADTGSVLLVEPDGQTLKIAASYGLDERVVKEERVAIGEKISGWVVLHNEPQLVLGEIPRDPVSPGAPRSKPASVGMVLPMRGREKVIGALCVSRQEGTQPFTRNDVELGLLLAGEVARVVERASAAEQQMDLERNLMRRDKLVTIGELASGVAHEINNPLGYVSSNVSSLQEYVQELLPVIESLAEIRRNGKLEDVLDKVAKVDLPFILSDLPTCLRETQEGVGRVLKIVSDLKSFSRDDQEIKETGDLNQIIDGAANILCNQIKYKAELVREYTEVPPILCHPSQLGQVFLNLLYNASQAIENNGRIVVRTSLAEDSIAIEVEDNGPGMDSETAARVFEPFFTTKPRGVGTGLGLSIAKKIIERHDGRIEVESQAGKGSTFRVTLPLLTGS